MRENGEKRKRRGKGRGKFVAGAAAAVLLLGGGLGFGFGTGAFGNADNAVPAVAQQSGAPVVIEESAPKSSSGKTLPGITVQEANVFYGGGAKAQVTIDELKNHLLADYEGSGVIVIKDDKAIKATFDEVVSVLDELAIPYSIQ